MASVLIVLGVALGIGLSAVKHAGRPSPQRTPHERERSVAKAASSHQRVMSLLRAGDKAGALATAREMTRRAPKDPTGWNAQAIAAAVAGENEVAAAAFERWFALAPRDPNAHSGYGFFLHRTGQTAKAREVLAKAVKDFPADGLIWMNYGVVLDALGERELAAEARRKSDALLTREQRAGLLR